MVKKCEQCRAPAVDSQSLFCNLCGGYIRDEPEAVLPVCRACGASAPDEQSVFCTRCGLQYARKPEDLYPICTSCGSIVPDELAAFCNRCGEKILSETKHSPRICATCGSPAVDDQTLFCNRCGSPFSPPAVEGAKNKATESVVITKKRRSPLQPDYRKTDVSDALLSDPSRSSLSNQPVTPVHKKSLPLPLQEDENVPAISRSKKYAHLPMVADELMIKDTSQHGHHSADVPEPPAGHKKKHPPDKGLLHMFKR